VIDRNLRRRHLDESQRAMVAASLANMKIGHPVLTRSIDRIETQVSQTKAAELLNVGAKSVERAAKVRKDGDPELVRAVSATASAERSTF
jgi:hypothetical protein